VDKLSWDEMANRRVERWGWRIWRINDTEEKCMKQVDLILQEHKEAEKLCVEGDVIVNPNSIPSML